LVKAITDSERVREAKTYTTTVTLRRLTEPGSEDVEKVQALQESLDFSNIVHDAAITLDDHTISFTGQIYCAGGLERVEQLAKYAMIFGSIEAAGVFPDPRDIEVYAEAD
jgi:hypothetical protein